MKRKAAVMKTSSSFYVTLTKQHAVAAEFSTFLPKEVDFAGVDYEVALTTF